jgi:hypothetical protein
LFDHDPFDAVNSDPCCAVPLIVGAAVFTGAAGGGGALTAWVCAEVADPEPPALVALTTTSIVLPTSPAWTV